MSDMPDTQWASSANVWLGLLRASYKGRRMDGWDERSLLGLVVSITEHHQTKTWIM